MRAVTLRDNAQSPLWIIWMRWFHCVTSHADRNGIHRHIVLALHFHSNCLVSTALPTQRRGRNQLQHAHCHTQTVHCDARCRPSGRLRVSRRQRHLHHHHQRRAQGLCRCEVRWNHSDVHGRRAVCLWPVCQRRRLRLHIDITITKIFVHLP